jgi:hypothetical protein
MHENNSKDACNNRNHHIQQGRQQQGRLDQQGRFWNKRDTATARSTATAGTQATQVRVGTAENAGTKGTPTYYELQYQQGRPQGCPTFWAASGRKHEQGRSK